jgi:hypothetical protein
MHDAPPSILLAETHGEAKFEVDFLARAQVAASANRSGKGHLCAGCNSNVVKIELHRLGRPVVEHTHVAMYASSPRDKKGGGTSNIKMSGS